MPKCAIYGCNNSPVKTTGTGVKYHTFPKNQILAKLWANACGRLEFFDTTHARICSTHFDDTCLVLPREEFNLIAKTLPKTTRNLRDDAVPNINLPTSKSDLLKQGYHRSNRKGKTPRKSKKSNEITPFAYEVNNVNLNSIKIEPKEYYYHSENEEERDPEEEAVVKREDYTNIGLLKMKISYLEHANNELKAICERLMTERNNALIKLSTAKIKSQKKKKPKMKKPITKQNNSLLMVKSKSKRS